MAATRGPVDYFLTGKLLTKIWDLHLEDSDDDDVTPLSPPTRHVPSIHDFLVSSPPVSTQCDIDRVPSPQAATLPNGHHTSHAQLHASYTLSSPVSSSDEELPRHIPSVYDFVDTPTTHVECTVDSVATPLADVAIPLGDVAMHHHTKPTRSTCWQENPPQADTDPLLRQNVVLPTLPSLPTTHPPLHCTSAQPGSPCSQRPVIPLLPLGERTEREGDQCGSWDSNVECLKQQSGMSFSAKTSTRCQSSNLSQRVQPFAGTNPYSPFPWTPPVSPPPEFFKLPPAPPPNLAALPYELLELLLSSLELADLLRCRAVSRRLCAAASSRMRGHRLLLSGHGKLDGFALSAFCWLQPSRVELCHVSGCVGRDELAHFLRAGKDCVKSLKYISCCVMTDPGGEVCLLQHLARHWRGLRELTVFLPTHLTERTTRTIFQHLHSLSQVSVDGSPLNCCEAIRTMATQHRLSCLSLPSHLLCREELQCVLKDACFSQCLEEMELKGITNPSVEWLVALSEVLLGFTNLKRLTLSASTQLQQDATRELLDVVCERTSQLNHLRLVRLTAGQTALARLAGRKVTIEQ